MKKLLLSLLILFFLLFASLIFLPYIFKDKIVETIKKGINEELRANVDFNNNIKINLFRSFPNLNVGISDFLLSSEDTFFVNDTIFYSKNSELVFDLKKWYKNKEYLVRNISFQQPLLNLEVNKDGLVNWDVMYPDSIEKEKSEAISFQLDRFNITNGRVQYIDFESDINFSLRNLNHLSSGTFALDSFILSAQTSMEDVLMSYQGIHYVNFKEVIQSGDIGVDMVRFKYSFMDNEFNINALPIDFGGYLQLNDDDIIFDMAAQSKSNNVKEFLTLIPAIYASDFEQMSATGKANLAFTFFGKIDETQMPDFDLKLIVDNGSFKYPDFPYPLQNLYFDLHVFSKQGNYDLMEVALNFFSFNLNESPFEGFVKLKNIFGNPYIDAAAHGTVVLDDFRKVMPLPSDMILNGKLVSDLSIKGTIDDISNNSVEKFSANGELFAQNLAYKTSDMPEKLEVSSAKLLFNNQNLQLSIFNAKLGRNDLNINGYIENFFSYLLANGTLKGDINVLSKYFNLNDFLAEGSNTTKVENTEIALSVIQIPGNVDMKLGLIVEELIYDDYLFDDFSGSSIVSNGVLRLDKVRAGFLGGDVSLDGTYQVQEEKPRARFDVGYKDININQLFPKFTIFQKFAPFVEEISALSSAKISFETDLDGQMKPVLSNINLDGFFQLAQVNIGGLEVFNQLNKQLGIQTFSAKKIKDFFLNFKIEKGKLLVSPFNVLIDSSILKINGFTLLDGQINYNGLLSLPAVYLNNKQDKFNNLVKNTPFTGYAIKPGDFFEIALKIGGTVKKPSVTLNLKEIKENIKNQLRATVKNEIDTRKLELENRVKTESDRLKQEALDRAKKEEEKLRAEIESKKEEAERKAREELERRKKEAEDQAKLEVEKAREKLKEEAKKRLLKGL